jgi:hypothetical protein
MHTIEKTNGSELTQHSSSDGLNSVPDEFLGLYQASYQAGYASGREAGFRQGYQAGFGDGRGQRNDIAAPAAVENVPTNAAVMKSRLFGLPCTKCRRLMYSDETRCAYCKAPLATFVEPPSETCCDPEQARNRERVAG